MRDLPSPLRTALLACVIALLGAASATAQEAPAEAGAIAGVVVDGETGETLIGANVVLDDTTTAGGGVIGATTDLDGRFEIDGLAPGTYDVRISYIGYQTKTVQGVAVRDGETAEIEITLSSDTAELGEVVVTAEAALDSEAGLLRQRQRAAAISNAISAEAISATGGSTAAGAIEKVTGASVVGGKYVYVRGLGGRYMNTQLNGAELPSADPDENAVPLDLFPAGMLDNIVTSKTFTPDQPGNFTGGNVNLNTTSYPQDFSFALSSSVAYNSAVGYNDMLLATGGLNAVPGAVNGGVPRVTEVYGAADPAEGERMAEQIDAVTSAFSPVMGPVSQTAPLNQSYSLFLGNEFTLFGDRPLGLVASLSYDQSTSGYRGGTSGRYTLANDINDEVLVRQLDLDDRSGTVEELIGGLATLSFKPHAKHEVGLTFLYNRSDLRSARFQSGFSSELTTGDNVFQTRTLRQVERALWSGQARGEHVFGAGLFGSDRGARLTWNAALSRTTQDEPDFRLFASEFDAEEDRYGTGSTTYDPPTRYFRELTETSRSGDAAVSVPFGPVSLKVGGSHVQVDRTFRERQFQYNLNPSVALFEGNDEVFFGEKAGLVEREGSNYVFGNVIVEQTRRLNNYDGEQTVSAGFAMIDLPMPGLEALRVVGGARLERTDLLVTTVVEGAEKGRIEEADWLPSVNLTYALTDNMNARLAYGRTLARPTFREIAPFTSTSYIGAETVKGNTALERTLIDNLDLRWEWFLRPGELVAVSAFYKNFTNPIERAIVSGAANLEVQYQNVERAMVAGFELEARKRLDFIAGWLRHVSAGANLTITRSDVDIPEEELRNRRAKDPDAPDTRQLQGQSPYVVNADLGYENPELGTSMGLFYNVFGERLYAVNKDGSPNRFEQPRHTIDLIASQRLPFGLAVKFSAKNLLDATYEVSQAFKGETYVSRGYLLGRSFSLGLTYSL